jgi:hypothetical protein
MDRTHSRGLSFFLVFFNKNDYAVFYIHNILFGNDASGSKIRTKSYLTWLGDKDDDAFGYRFPQWRTHCEATAS